MADGKKELLIKALKSLKELNKINTDLGGGFIVTPVLISETLCKELLGYTDRESGAKDHDAKNGTIKVEIKATSSATGTTTYNPANEVDEYVWVQLDYDNEKIYIRNAKKLEMKEIAHPEDEPETEDEIIVTTKQVEDIALSTRKSITLSKYKWDEVGTYRMDDLSKID